MRPASDSSTLPGKRGPSNVQCSAFTLDRLASGPLLRNMRLAGLALPTPADWGSLKAYLRVLDDSAPFVLLDVPHPRWLADVDQRISVLSRLSPVIALVPTGADNSGLLSAGAVNVLNRDMCIRELAARLAAEQRWFIAARAGGSPISPGPVPRSMHPLPLHGSQQLLMRLLVQYWRPWCCHDLCLLLGTSDQPLSRPTLRARLVRIEPYLARAGLTLRRSGRWGRIHYQVTETVPSTASHGRR
ncbi:hypothetical protein [Streptomyces sp. NPDC051636]|uniref:hypothetical protein n=1 Tax=Streptomyces sp. NPDC051636 TaxID=3365663 RepID=UPI0037A1F052